MNEYGKRLNALAEWMGVEFAKHHRHSLNYTRDDLALITPWFVHDDAEAYLKENFLIALKNDDLKHETHPVATFMILVHNLFAAKPKEPDPKCNARAHIRYTWFGVYDFAYAVSMEKDSESGKWGLGDSCWLSARTVAIRCNMNKNTAAKAIRWLVANGWLEDLGRDGAQDGYRVRYRVVSHDEWTCRQDGLWEPCVGIDPRRVKARKG